MDIIQDIEIVISREQKQKCIVSENTGYSLKVYSFVSAPFIEDVNDFLGITMFVFELKV